MKATGIVRRIDDLGRVVIPKEIRRTLHIREGDPLEIYTEKDGEVIFKKYSPMGDLGDFAIQICESIEKNTGLIAAITDRDTLIALSGAPKKDFLDRRNGAELDQLIHGRKPYRFASGGKKIKVTEAVDEYYIGAAAPILADSDSIGCLLLLLDDKLQPLSESDLKLAQTVAGFLGAQMEH